MGSINFTAPPTVAACLRSNAFGRVLAGPVGSAKTTGLVMECLRRAVQQTPAADGYRYTRFAIVRQTFKQLRDTVLKEMDSWYEGMGAWKVSESTWHLLFDDVRSELVFIPLENADDQARLLSMQLTGAWISELIECKIDILGPISGRLGRYPSGKRGTPTWHGWFADTNMPTELTPWHDFMANPPPNVQVFRQPSGLSPQAENLDHLLQTEESVKLPLGHPARLAQGRRYYENLVATYGAGSDWVKRYVYAEYGDDPSGQGVFRESFKTDFHTRDETELIPGYPLIIGQDFGRNPWSIICQPDWLGRLIVHEEVAAHNVGLEKHINERLRPKLMTERYFGYKVALVGDPAGVAKDSISEETSFDAIKRLGLPAFPAPTNDIDPRLRAVEALLTRQVNGGPALIINRSKCPFLVRAMAGGYRFTKTRGGALKPKPDKADAEGFSHIADALQYAALVVHGNMVDYIARNLRPKVKRQGQAVTAAGWT